jgi:GAF domain-containing protein
MSLPQQLAEASRAINSGRSVGDVLRAVTDKAREIVPAHQAVTSVVIDGNWARAINAISLSDKYAAWRAYTEQPDGSGIYRLVCEMNRPLRMTQAELEAHPAWHGFGKAAGRHPPMRGWLAAPLTGRHGRNIGLIQLSDKYEGDFTEEDEAVLVQLAQMASIAIENVRSESRKMRRPSP